MSKKTKKNLERIVFFVKPDCEDPLIDKATALEVVNFLESKLRRDGLGFKRVTGIRTGRIPKEFWLEFYKHIEEGYPQIYKPMCEEFAGKDLAVFIYEGENIAKRIKDIVGPTFYARNIDQDTIRRWWGNPNMGYRTIVHSSDKEAAKKEIELFKKYGYLEEIEITTIAA